MKRTRIRPRNEERCAEKFERNFGEKSDWIRARPCLVRVCRSVHIQAAHVIARGMGSSKGDIRHLIPLCYWHHVEASEYRTTARAEFELRNGLDRGVPGEGLVLIADELHQAWLDGEDYGPPF